MNNNEKSCANCAHRYGMSKEYYRCLRTGYYCSVETKLGGLCASGQELKLWAPRKTLLQRVISIVREA